MDAAFIEQLRTVIAAFNHGDTDPLVGLLDDDMEWRGAPLGRLWWKTAPS